MVSPRASKTSGTALYFSQGSSDGGPGDEEIEHVDSLSITLAYLYAFCVTDYIPWLRWIIDFDKHEKILRKAISTTRKYQDSLIDNRIQQCDPGAAGFYGRKGQAVQESDIPNLNYIKACVRETFRLHPVAPFNLAHVTTANATVAGYFIPKGSHVIVSHLGLGRNPQQIGSNNGAKDEIDHHYAAGIACLNSQIDLLELLEDSIYDTGASDHMTPIHSSVFDPYLFKIKPQIKLPNGDTSVISHVGKVKLDNGILLKDVFVVPSFKFSLLSVPKLTEDGQCVVSFYLKFCVVQDLTTRKVKGLDLVQTALQKFACTVVNKKDSGSYALWHHKLGHVSHSKLKHMNELHVSLSKSCLDRCLSCLMAKFTKLPYDLSNSHSTSVFKLIHIDIWGPYKVPTDGKFRYFLTIVDDCSKGTWVYLLEHKSESSDALKSFLKFVCTQFGKQVKIVRSDNALEFIKGQCGPYLTSHGIVHQTSCVDRPQQNGRVERKHKHILDTVRALSFYSKVPLKF
nr:retrovirus-related Pol polyprotein from transposon TNT 1-94 [Tanacetum cinerariifolium]